MFFRLNNVARRVLAWGALGLLLLFAVYLCFIAARVWSTAKKDEARPAGAIVIFGAAEYRGRPSPVLRARLDHALALYQRGLAPKIITTGGPGGDPNFTEAGVERNYLVEYGVPSEDVYMEDESTTTSETVLNVIEIMRRDNVHSCVVVSDGYHLFRILRLFRARGIAAYGSPREVRGKIPFWERLRITIREVFGYVLNEVGIRV
jgi:uncharacterized SAM-binding protein YcdF (DUF218 family)